MDPKINKPCPADWNQMTGDQKSRHCDKCNKSVHNISELTAEEAESVLCQSTKSVCIRIQQATNGAFKTQSGWMKRVAIAGAATLTLIPMTGCEPEPQMTGKVATPIAQPQNPEEQNPVAGAIPAPVEHQPLTGEVVAPPSDIEQGEMTTGKVAAPEVMGDIAPAMGNEVVPESKPIKTLPRPK